MNNDATPSWVDEFPVNEEVLYLNHAAVAPWPERAREAVSTFAAENTAFGATNYPQWIKTEQALKHNLEQLIDAPAGSVALVKNTSEALSFVAAGIDWQDGDLVVITDQEFPSNRIVWQSLEKRGVKVVEVSLPWDAPEKELLEAIAQKPRLVSVSAVQYATGLTLDVLSLGEACRSAGTLFCVDAIQATGVLPFSVQAIQADFAMADGHKWLLGPEGLGFFYVNPDVMDQLAVTEYGWHMVEDVGNYDNRDWQLAADARRFECGSPNMLAATALKASTDLLLEVGMTEVATQAVSNVLYLRQLLEDKNAVFVNPLVDKRPSGILTFHFLGKDSGKIYKLLMENGIICAHRGGGIRFSPHFHTTQEVMNDAIDALEFILEMV
ncbi:MAG: aminotransferase [Oceanospirillaceae bacterium]|nr:aminotransferase [Oceanospirillaceae bacterium]MBT12398.1 aminotransferase [Oceanospirillaceae bacterium]